MHYLNKKKELSLDWLWAFLFPMHHCAPSSYDTVLSLPTPKSSLVSSFCSQNKLYNFRENFANPYIYTLS